MSYSILCDASFVRYRILLHSFNSINRNSTLSNLFSFHLNEMTQHIPMEDEPLLSLAVTPSEVSSANNVMCACKKGEADMPEKNAMKNIGFSDLFICSQGDTFWLRDSKQ